MLLKPQTWENNFGCKEEDFIVLFLEKTFSVMRCNLWGGQHWQQRSPNSSLYPQKHCFFHPLHFWGESVFIPCSCPLLSLPAVFQGQQGAGCWCGNQSLTTTRFTKGHRQQPSDIDNVEWLLTLFLASADIKWRLASLHQLKACPLMVAIILIFTVALRKLQLLCFTSLTLICHASVFWCYL